MQSARLTTFTVATNEFRGGNNERTEYHPCVAWDRLAEITGQFLSKGQLVDVEGRLQTRQWDDDAGKRHWKTEVVVSTLEMLSGRSKKEYAAEAQAVAEADGTPTANGAAEDALEAIADLAILRKIGARGLRMIIEDLMLDLMYNLPSMKKVKECVVTRDVVLDREKPITLIEKVG